MITKSNLGTFAGNLLKVLEREKINSFEAAMLLAERRFYVADSPIEFIDFSKRHSNSNTIAYKMSYTLNQVAGIPIEVVMNPTLNYTQFICKSQDSLKGYNVWAVDGLGNPIHLKKELSVDWKLILSELSMFRDLKL